MKAILERLYNGIIKENPVLVLMGAGLRLASFMELVEEQKLPFHASCILVSSAKGNPSTAFEIPIVEIAGAELCEAEKLWFAEVDGVFDVAFHDVVAYALHEGLVVA